MMGHLWFLLLLLVPNSVHGFFFDGLPVVPPTPVSIQTPVGEILGQSKTIQFDGNTYGVQTFLGIPYAEAPVGRNRFRKPISKAAFTAPFSAFDFGASCLQAPGYGVDQKTTLAEDCLFLNIFVPQLTQSTISKIPVMVWIHGGGFVGGSSIYYVGDTLSAYGEVIVVTLNYRLAHMGFLRTKENDANFGLWDQHLAFKWVHDNIGSFGGDVNNITIFGESAGSSSVVYQVLFPGNKGLFQRAIAESGGITSPWAFSTNKSADIIFQNFTTEIGCNAGDHYSIMACLRNKTTVEVSNVMKSDSLSYNNVVPIMDRDFVPKHPQEMMVPTAMSDKSLDVFHNIDFMMGSCSVDGAVFLPEFASAAGVTDLERFRATRDDFERSYIPGAIAAIFTNIPTIPQIAKDMTVYQYTNWTNPEDDLARMHKLVDLFTDSALFVPMVATAKLHTGGSNHRTYVYEFSTAPTTHLLATPAWLDQPTHANHADDLLFVFGFSDKMIASISFNDKPIRYTRNDIQAAKNIISMWTNFAKSGNPNKPYSIPTHWPQYNMTSQYYLDITPTITSESVKQRIAARRVAFWQKLLPSLLK